MTEGEEDSGVLSQETDDAFPSQRMCAQFHFDYIFKSFYLIYIASTSINQCFSIKYGNLLRHISYSRLLHEYKSSAPWIFAMIRLNPPSSTQLYTQQHKWLWYVVVRCDTVPDSLTPLPSNLGLVPHTWRCLIVCLFLGSSAGLVGYGAVFWCTLNALMNKP